MTIIRTLRVSGPVKPNPMKTPAKIFPTIYDTVKKNPNFINPVKSQKLPR